MKRNATKRTVTPRRPPAECYDSMGYAHAIARGILNANRAGCRNPDFGPALPPVPHWHPNQLRHLFATQVRRLHGLEAAQVMLGHSKADVTQIYAEKNEAKAAEIAAMIG